jgi:hypothetical protein
MILTINLKAEEEELLNSKARAEGVSAEQYAQQLLKGALAVDSAPLLSSQEQACEDDCPIWEVFGNSMRDVPPEALAALPKDGASQIDHYVYGHPKT